MGGAQFPRGSAPAGPLAERRDFGSETSLRPPTGRVLAGVGGLLALLVVAVAVAAVLAIDLRDATVRADRHVDYVNAMNLAALNAKGIANDERGFLISGEGEFVREIDVRTRNVRSALDEADRAAVGNAQHAAVYDARDGFEDWLWAVRTEIARYRGGDREGAIASSLGETRQLRKENEAAFDRARTLGESGVEASTTTLSEASWRAVRILVVYLVVAFAVGFVLTVWLVRSVLRPAGSVGRPVSERTGDVRHLR